MKPNLLLVTTLAFSAALPLSADVLELKSGKTVVGKYVGGTAGTVRFETTAGVQVVETSQILALTFTGNGQAPAGSSSAAAAPAAAAAAAPAPAPAPAPAAPTSVSIPAGANLMVRMVDPVSSKDPKGKRFTTTLETDLVVNGAVVAKAGTKVYGRIHNVQQARRYTGQSLVDLRLTELAVGANLVPIVTSGYTDAGARSIGKAARGAAAGAAIGAIADGGEGAGKGAAIGAAASGIKKGQTISIPPGALLDFKLEQPVSVTVTK